MDPLSISASIIAVLQATSATINVCWKWKTAIKDGPWNLVLKDLQLLRGTLENLAQLSEEVEESTGDPRLPMLRQLYNPGQTSGPLLECQRELEQLQQTLKLPTHTGQEDISKARLVMKALRWPFDEARVKESLSRLRSFQETFALALQADSVKILLQAASGISDIRSTQISAEREKRRNELRRWLSPPDPLLNHHAACEKRHESTGSWLITDRRFISWKESPNSLLWLHGIPGAGKSVLSSTIINNLLLDGASNASLKVAYFYFDINDPAKQDAYSMVQSLIFQLSEQDQTIGQPLDDLYASCQNGSRRPSSKALLNTLQQILQVSPETCIVLDALDECLDREPLLEIIQTIHEQKIHGLHLLATSRREGDIEETFEPILGKEWWIDLQNSCVEDDIDSYVRFRLSSDPRLKRWESNTQLQEEILAVFREKAGGMFRWATCQLEVLRKRDNIALVRKALKALPKDLDETYERILLNIDEDYIEYVHAVLQWLAYCHHPMSVEQIADVVLVDHDLDLPTFDEARRISPQRIAALCSGLISIVTVKRDHYVGDKSMITQFRFAHSSVREYLLSKRAQTGPASAYSIEMAAANTFILNTCLAYVLSFTQSVIDAYLVREDFPLASYAALFWIEYMKSSSEAKTSALITKLFQDSKGNTYRNWLSLLVAGSNSNPYLNHPRQSTVRMLSGGTNENWSCFAPPLVWASALGLTALVRQLLATDNEVNVNQSGVSGVSALAIATHEKHSGIEEILLSRGGDVSETYEEEDSRKNELFRAPLYYAARFGDHKSLEILLRDRTRYGRPGWKLEIALEGAADFGAVGSVHQLINAGVDVNALGREYGCALDAASQRGHPEIVRMLLDAGADPNLLGGRYGCALQAAAYWKQPEITRMLLDAGANVDVQGGMYGTSLIAASWRGDAGVVSQLLDAGADTFVQWDLHEMLYELNFWVRVNGKMGQGTKSGRRHRRRDGIEQAQMEQELATRQPLDDTPGGEWELWQRIKKGADRTNESMGRMFSPRIGAINGQKYLVAYYGRLQHIRTAGVRIARRVRKAGVRVDEKGRYMFSAVQAAVAAEHETVVGLLADKGVEVPQPITDGGVQGEKKDGEAIARILRVRDNFEYHERTRDGTVGMHSIGGLPAKNKKA